MYNANPVYPTTSTVWGAVLTYNQTSNMISCLGITEKTAVLVYIRK